MARRRVRVREPFLINPSMNPPRFLRFHGRRSKRILPKRLWKYDIMTGQRIIRRKYNPYKMPSFLECGPGGRFRKKRGAIVPFSISPSLGTPRETIAALRRSSRYRRLYHRVKLGRPYRKRGRRRGYTSVRFRHRIPKVKWYSFNPVRRRHNAMRGRKPRRWRGRRYFRKPIRMRRLRIWVNPRRRRHNPLSIIGFNPRRRHSSRRRHHSRRRHRNPAGAGILTLGSGLRVGSIVPLMVTAGVSTVVTKLIPGFLGATVLANQWFRYGVQIGSGFVGYMALSRFLGREHGLIWAASAGGVVIADLLQGWLLTTMTATPAAAAGFGFAPGSYRMPQYQYPNYVGAFTQTPIPGNAVGLPGQIGAFVDPFHSGQF